MKIKPVFVGIAVVGVLLLLLSLSAVAQVIGASPSKALAGVKNQPMAMQLLPKRSPSFVSFLVNPEKLGLFAQLTAKTSDRANVRHELDRLKQQLRQNWLLDYERDVKPWLDQEITLAVTDVDLDRQPDNGLQAGYLLAFVAKDAKLAKTTIEDFWQRLAITGADLGFEQYQGVSILNTRFAAARPAIAGMTIGKFVLFANDVQVLREVINNLQAPSLAIASLDALSPLDNRQIGIAYINLGGQSSLLVSLGLDRSQLRARTLLTFKNSVAKDDFAIALHPQPSRNPDWFLVANVNDAKASEAAIAFLDDLAKNNLTVGQISLKAQPVTVWTKLSVITNKSEHNSKAIVTGDIVAAHAQTKSHIYLSNSLTALESAIGKE
jgi:hypothetical protein